VLESAGILVDFARKSRVGGILGAVNLGTFNGKY